MDTQNPCPVCLRVFRNMQEMLLHLKQHSLENKFVCCICCAFYDSKIQLIQHYKTKHPNSKEILLPIDNGLQVSCALFVCKICKKQFSETIALKAHSRTHKPKETSEAKQKKTKRKETFEAKSRFQTRNSSFKKLLRPSTSHKPIWARKATSNTPSKCFPVLPTDESPSVPTTSLIHLPQLQSFSCTQCCETFLNKKDLGHHQVSTHGNENNNTEADVNLCENCGVVCAGSFPCISCLSYDQMEQCKTLTISLPKTLNSPNESRVSGNTTLTKPVRNCSVVGKYQVPESSSLVKARSIPLNHDQNVMCNICYAFFPDDKSVESHKEVHVKQGYIGLRKQRLNSNTVDTLTVIENLDGRKDTFMDSPGCTNSDQKVDSHSRSDRKIDCNGRSHTVSGEQKISSPFCDRTSSGDKEENTATSVISPGCIDGLHNSEKALLDAGNPKKRLGPRTKVVADSDANFMQKPVTKSDEMIGQKRTRGRPKALLTDSTVLTCPLCYQVMTVKQYYGHKKKKHPDAGHICVNCGQELEDVKSLHKHQAEERAALKENVALSSRSAPTQELSILEGHTELCAEPIPGNELRSKSATGTLASKSGETDIQGGISENMAEELPDPSELLDSLMVKIEEVDTVWTSNQPSVDMNQERPCHVVEDPLKQAVEQGKTIRLKMSSASGPFQSHTSKTSQPAKNCNSSRDLLTLGIENNAIPVSRGWSLAELGPSTKSIDSSKFLEGRDSQPVSGKTDIIEDDIHTMPGFGRVMPEDIVRLYSEKKTTVTQAKRLSLDGSLYQEARIAVQKTRKRTSSCFEGNSSSQELGNAPMHQGAKRHQSSSQRSSGHTVDDGTTRTNCLNLTQAQTTAGAQTVAAVVPSAIAGPSSQFSPGEISSAEHSYLNPVQASLTSTTSNNAPLNQGAASNGSSAQPASGQNNYMEPAQAQTTPVFVAPSVTVLSNHFLPRGISFAQCSYLNPVQVSLNPTASSIGPVIARPGAFPVLSSMHSQARGNLMIPASGFPLLMPMCTPKGVTYVPVPARFLPRLPTFFAQNNTAGPGSDTRFTVPSVRGLYPNAGIQSVPRYTRLIAPLWNPSHCPTSTNFTTGFVTAYQSVVGPSTSFPGSGQLGGTGLVHGHARHPAVVDPTIGKPKRSKRSSGTNRSNLGPEMRSLCTSSASAVSSNASGQLLPDPSAFQELLQWTKRQSQQHMQSSNSQQDLQTRMIENQQQPLGFQNIGQSHPSSHASAGVAGVCSTGGSSRFAQPVAPNMLSYGNGSSYVLPSSRLPPPPYLCSANRPSRPFQGERLSGPRHIRILPNQTPGVWSAPRNQTGWLSGPQLQHGAVQYMPTNTFPQYQGLGFQPYRPQTQHLSNDNGLAHQVGSYVVQQPQFYHAVPESQSQGFQSHIRGNSGVPAQQHWPPHILQSQPDVRLRTHAGNLPAQENAVTEAALRDEHVPVQFQGAAACTTSWSRGHQAFSSERPNIAPVPPADARSESLAVREAAHASSMAGYLWPNQALPGKSCSSQPASNTLDNGLAQGAASSNSVPFVPGNQPDPSGFANLAVGTEDEVSIIEQPSRGSNRSGNDWSFRRVSQTSPDSSYAEVVSSSPVALEQIISTGADIDLSSAPLLLNATRTKTQLQSHLVNNKGNQSGRVYPAMSVSVTDPLVSVIITDVRGSLSQSDQAATPDSLFAKDIPDATVPSSNEKAVKSSNQFGGNCNSSARPTLPHVQQVQEDSSYVSSAIVKVPSGTRHSLILSRLVETLLEASPVEDNQKQDSEREAEKRNASSQPPSSSREESSENHPKHFLSKDTVLQEQGTSTARKPSSTDDFNSVTHSVPSQMRLNSSPVQEGGPSAILKPSSIDDSNPSGTHSMPSPVRLNSSPVQEGFFSTIYKSSSTGSNPSGTHSVPPSIRPYSSPVPEGDSSKILRSSSTGSNSSGPDSVPPTFELPLRSRQVQAERSYSSPVQEGDSSKILRSSSTGSNSSGPDSVPPTFELPLRSRQVQAERSYSSPVQEGDFSKIFRSSSTGSNSSGPDSVPPTVQLPLRSQQVQSERSYSSSVQEGDSSKIFRSSSTGSNSSGPDSVPPTAELPLRSQQVQAEKKENKPTNEDTVVALPAADLDTEVVFAGMTQIPKTCFRKSGDKKVFVCALCNQECRDAVRLRFHMKNRHD